ncbi:MAG: transposase [Verrucomicrobiota bacterium]
MRKTPSLENLLPTLFLKGVSNDQMGEALGSILGEGAAGLSAASVRRLRKDWTNDFESWSKRDLSDKRYVYFWVEGVYFNVRLTDERPWVLVTWARYPMVRRNLSPFMTGSVNPNSPGSKS